jgi:hypothetical protein
MLFSHLLTVKTGINRKGTERERESERERGGPVGRRKAQVSLKFTNILNAGDSKIRSSSWARWRKESVFILSLTRH